MTEDYTKDTNFLDDNNYDQFSEYQPKDDGYDVFNLRTNTENMLHRFELNIRNKYERKNKEGKTIIEQIPGTKPCCNEQGIQGIMAEVRNIINNHTVQWNAQTKDDLHRERFNIGQNIIHCFFTNRKEWDLSVNDAYRFTNLATNLINIFLTRGLDNQERLLYGQTFKENVTRTVGNEAQKSNPLKEALRFFGGKTQ